MVISRDALWASGHDETVEVNQRALIDKVLARYSGEFTVFRELLQNSDDARAKEVEIRFETKEFHDRNAEGASSSSDSQHVQANGVSEGLPDLRTTLVHHWNFRNNGIVFREEDWNRLRKIAEGNPDEEKIGAFGVGFYSLFSVTEEPFVSSGDQWMGFHWKDNKDQLLARRGPMPTASPNDPWTTFNMPLRDPVAIPPPFDLTRFLASSITFMVNLEVVSIYFNDKCLSKLNKSVGLPKQLSIAPASSHLHKKRASEKGFMHVAGIAQTTLYIEAQVMAWVYLFGTEKKPPPPKLLQKPVAAKSGGFFSSLFGFSTPQRGNTPLPAVAPIVEEKPLDPHNVINTSISLSIYSADVDVKLDNKSLNELQRSTKKRPPAKMKCALIYTGKNEYDSSMEEDKRLPFKTGSVFQGLRADIDGTGHAKIFIGHATGQTTGIGGHVSGRFIPTVERESIDLMDRTVAVWNRELLWVTGYLSRCAYELELAHIRTLWEGALLPDTREPPPELQTQLSARALHTLQFFTFNGSTPSSDVSYLIQTAFFSCAPPDIPLMTSAGVRSASSVRMPDPAFSGFLKHLPVVPQETIDNAGTMIAYLREKGAVKETTFKDVLDELSARPLTEVEMVACLTWWCGLTRQGESLRSPELLRVRTQLINAALILTQPTVGGSSTEKVVPLSVVTAFINKKGSAGAHIPTTGALPDYVLPFSISHHFKADILTTAMPWRELTVVDWLSHICSAEANVDIDHNITLSPVFAEEVLLILSRSLPSLPAKSQPEIKAILKDKACIPTTGGMMPPGNAYFPNVDIFKDLPVVKLPSNTMIKGNLDRLLEMLGVRKHVELQMVFNKIKTGDWTINDLVKYLVSVQATLTEDELRRLRLTSAFLAEGEHLAEDGKTRRFQAQELYEPSDNMRNLNLPVIAWGTHTKWRSTSDEARFLFKLGLRRLPPLKTVIDLCASEKETLRTHGLKYLLDNLGTHYSDYRPSDFATVAYIPALKDGKECLAIPKEVYSSPEWALMEFCIISSSSQHQDLGTKLKLQKHPSPESVISLLRRQPPKDETQARQWFEVLAGRIPDFESKHLKTLSEVPFVPTRATKDAVLRYLPPSHCFFGSSVRTGLHSQLFVFVDFGPSAGAFLAACGTKSEPSVEEIVQILLADPHKFYDMAKGAESFLNELRNIAVNSRGLSSATLARLKRGSVLLGMRRKPTGKPAADLDEETWEMQYDLKRADQIIVADDTSSYHLFGDNFFAAPQDDLLENFYLQLGSKRLSSLVKEKYNTTMELKDAKKSTVIRELVLERLPLFLHEHSHGEQTRIKFEWLNSQDNFSVKTFGKVEVEKSLTHDDLRLYKKQDASAVASRARTGSLQLWLAGHSEIDMYEVAVALCRYLFAAPKPNDALLLMTILSTDLTSLKRRGYNVDRILRKRSAQKQAAEEQARKHQETLMSRPIPAMPSKEISTGPAHHPPAPVPAAAQTAQSKEGDMPLEPKLPTVDPQRRSGHGLFNRIQDRLQSVMHKPSTGGVPPIRNPTVTPLNNIASNINMAISACRPEQSNLIRNREQMQMVKESLNEGYCDISGRGGDMVYVGMSGAYRFYVSKAAPQPETLLSEKGAVLSCFNEIIQRLQVVFQLEPKSIHIFYDLGGDLIAFNRNASLFLNLRYFEEWHLKDVSNGDPSSALISWYFTLAHEIAHNLVQPHNSEHEFYFSAICEKYIMGLGQLLAPSH